MRIFPCILLSIFAFSKAMAQDTLRLSLADADRQFLSQNLGLIAARADLDIARAATHQAKLWSNPQLQFENNLLNFTDKRFPDLKQQSVQIQQLILLAGKRHKLVDLQQGAERFTELQFYELTRNLKHQLHADFFDLANLYQKINWYNGQIGAFTALADTLDVQVKLGNFAEKDAIRVRAEVFGLSRERQELVLQAIDLQQNMQILLAPARPVVVVPVLPPANIQPAALSAETLAQTAFANRSDLLSAESAHTLAEKTVVYQKSLAHPDLTLGVDYDRRNSYVPNYVGIQFGLPLTVFNRNQGNIEAAQIAEKQQAQRRDAVRQQVSAEVAGAVDRIRAIQNWRSGNAGQFYDRYDDFFRKVQVAYQRKQVTLTEFMDYFQTFQDQKLQQIEQENELQMAIENLRYTVGKDEL